LGKANSALSSSLAKLSTGLRINTAADGPADLIISEKFRSQINSISKATENTQNAISMLSTAEGALAEVNSLLSKMQGLALKASQTGTQSADEIAASQAEIDAALESINTISRNTSFGSVNLLDGSKSIRTEGVDTSNILVDIDKANFAGNSKAIEVSVITAANRASTSIDLSAANQGDGATDGELLNSQVFKITGNRGSDSITFSSGSDATSIAEEINSRVSQTGVFAEVSNSVIELKSSDYGASEFVTIEDVDGDNDILDAAAGGAAGELSNVYKVADLTTEGAPGVTLGGVQILFTGAGSEQYEGYTINATFSAGATTAATINNTTNVITLTADIADDADAVATELSTLTGITAVAVHEGSTTFAANDSVSGLTIGKMTSGLQIRIKDGATPGNLSASPTVSIGVAGAGAAPVYNSVTNVLGLTLASGTAYSTAGIEALIPDNDVGAAIRNFFDFTVVGGASFINPTVANSPVSFEDTSISTSAYSVDLSSHDGTGGAFYSSNGTFGVKLVNEGVNKYGDYTINFYADAALGATDYDINDSAKTINIAAVAGTTSNAVIIGALNGLTNGTAFTSVVTIAGANTVGTADETSVLTNDGSGLTLTYKGEDSNGFVPGIRINTSAATSIRYNTAGFASINISTGTTISDQDAFNSVLNASAEAAELKGLFDFQVTGAIDASTNGVIDLTPGGAALGVGGSGTMTNYVKATGSDGTLEVNGVKTAANNLSFTWDDGNIRGHITIDESFNQAGQESSFTISGKGAFLQIGSKGQLSHQIGVGIGSIAADQLATGLYLDANLDPSNTSGLSNSDMFTTATLADIKAGGDFDLASNAGTAYDIISQAITEVSNARAKLGAIISNTLESNINSLGVAFENLTAAESRIRDVDFAAETAEFTRAQILVQAGTSVAAQANVATQAALQLLG
jgi:flagellin